MQSVPSEFIAHLRPLMFVGGLGTEQASQAGDQDSPEKGPFADLTRDLRQVLSTKRSFPTYEPAAARGQAADFHVMLVDKTLRFPPRKARLPNNQSGPHSPISPFTPNSPLYPDGLMAPIWIRKHRELVPSVYVLVLRLYEFGQAINADDPEESARAKQEIDIGPLEKEKIERLRDNELINEILNRKRSCSERGIKLAVVLLTSRDMLDDPALDARLSYVRRQSTLDSRASLFVLSPVPLAEVQSFVISLKSELYESSLDYYREHGRRLRRKRSRPAAGSGLGASIVGLGSASPPLGSEQPSTLSNQALNVRYDFKAAVFAEFRTESEVSLKHYEDCYSALYDLFLPSSVPATTPTGHVQLQPRTKRWAEARVLADCISFKICKMYIYIGNPAYAMMQYHHHLSKYSRLAEQYWNMGRQAFEYWSWAGKQHRLFAELVELAIRGGFKLPIAPTPTAGPPLQSRVTGQHVAANVMQHPGFYFYIAGLCAVKRKECFRRTCEKYDKATAADESFSEPAAVRHERNVPHSEQIIELFSHAYEYFKRAKSTRMTLSLASQISDIHAQDGNAEMSMRFDERIAKTYRREHWQSILSKVLSRSQRMASLPRKDTVTGESTGSNGTGASETRRIPELAQLVLEQLATPPGMTGQELDNDLKIFETVKQMPTSPIKLSDQDTPLPLSCEIAFWESDSDLNVGVPFQLKMGLDVIAKLRQADVQALEVVFSDGRPPVRITHSTNVPAVSSIDLGHISSKAAEHITACLTAPIPNHVLLSGTISSEVDLNVTLSLVTVHLLLAGIPLALDIHPKTKGNGGRWYTSDPAVPGKAQCLHLTGGDHSSCRFRPRKLRAKLNVCAPHFAYLNEAFAIPFTIKNVDSMPVNVSLDVLLHRYSSEAFTAGDFISLDKSERTGSDQATEIARADIVTELQTGQSVEKIIYLTSTGPPGVRKLDMKVTCKPTRQDVFEPVQPIELMQQLEVTVDHPVFCDFEVSYFRAPASSVPPRGMFDMSKPDPWYMAHRCLLDINLGALGPTSIEVLDVALDLSMSENQIRCSYSSIEDTRDDLGVFEPEVPFGIVYELEIIRSYAASTASAQVPPGMLQVEWKRPDGDDDSRTKTLIPLPAFTPPNSSPEDVEPIIVCDCPSKAVLHEAFNVVYALMIPPSIIPNVQTRTIAFQMEPTTDDCVFSGPRKVDRRLVLESGTRLAEYSVIPVGKTGRVELPHFRVWEMLDSPQVEEERKKQFMQEQTLGQEHQYGPRTRSLRIVRNSTLDTRPDDTPISVFVFPRQQ